MMPSLTRLNMAGDRVDIMNRLHDAKMKVGSKVCHGTSKGVYELAEVLSTDDGEKVKLKLLHKCISLSQLWAVLNEAMAKARSGGDAVPSRGISAVAMATALRPKAAPVMPPSTLESGASAAVEEVSTAGAGASAAIGVVSAAVGRVSAADGSDAKPEEKEFAEERAVALDMFLADWRLELSAPLVGYEMNPEWPDDRMATNARYQKIVAISCVYQAVFALGHKIDNCIKPASVLQCTSSPSVSFYAFPGRRTQESNRERKVGRGRGERGPKQVEPADAARPQKVTPIPKMVGPGVRPRPSAKPAGRFSLTSAENALPGGKGRGAGP